MIRPDNDARGSMFHGAVFFLLLGLTLAIYQPGLSGGYLLDDTSNLQELVQLRADPTLDNLLHFMGSSPSSVLSRPVSVATFAVQFHAWPGEPGDFKRINLALHLLNGCLLYWLFLRLARLMNRPELPLATLGLLATGLWLLHPLNLSTTLYIIQRMTQLAMLFTMIGILCYLQGRQRLLTDPDRPLSGYLWMSFGVGINTALATLSKENGLLLPLFILIIEATLLQHLPKPPYWWKRWAALFLVAPLATLILYLGSHWEHYFVLNYQTRDFTLVERLLTQCRILVEYLRLLFFPTLSDLGLFHDDYPLSRSLLNPPQTLAALLFILGLLVAGWRVRRRHPFFAFGVLWFFGGQVMESTILSLELYFEHRNYLPAAGLWLAVAVGAREVWNRLPSRLGQTALMTGLILLMLLYAFMTHTEATLWGDPVQQAEVWQQQKPHSRRAQSQLAEFHILAGQYEQAALLYRRLAERLPNDSGTLLYWIKLRCNRPELPKPDDAELLRRLKQGRLNLPALGELIKAMENDACPQLAPELLRAMLRTIPENPTFVPKVHGHLITFYAALLEQKSGHTELAMRHLETALQEKPMVSLALKKVAWLTESQRFAEAREAVQLARRLNRGNPLTWMTDQRRIEGWEQVITFLIDNSPRSAPP
ncbi:MAG: hypothetical protein HQM00_16255 [Magnetococcales bacterium]|nr:hypothetical protein [Magnetococcales bacterium]